MSQTQEQLDRLVASFPISCTQCNASNDSRSKFCAQCSAPLKDYEFDLLHAPALREGRKWMGWVAVLYVIGGVLFAAITASGQGAGPAIAVLALNLVLAATQGGLWWWAKRATFAAAVTSLALYVTVILIEAVFDPASLVRGWLIKIVFITALVKAIRAGLTVRRARLAAQALAVQRTAA
jgi:hypothetical protein